MLQKTILVISIGKNINYISVLIHSSDFINCRLDRGPIKPQDRLKSIFRRSFPISDLYLPDDRSAITDNRLKTYNGTTYYYDDLGNLIHRELADGEVQNYFYDLHDQLVKAEIFKKDGTKETWAYTYDALGRRIGKGRLKNEEVSDDLENQTYFVWDGSHLLQEILPDGRYTYIYTDPDSYEPLAQVRDWTTKDGESRQQTHYFHCDQIGIPREMTDKDGNLLWFGNYTGWGRLKEETRVTDSAYQPFRLQNQYCDRETGLHYNFFRYYEPDAGRFVNQDPIRLLGGVNFYRFAPNVQEWIDPLGLALSHVTFPSSQVIKEVTIYMQGSRGADFKAANAEAGIHGARGTATQGAHRAKYGDVTWHHVDYDSQSNRAKMQLVTRKDHEAKFPHAGSVSDFEKAHGVKYETPEAKKKASKLTKRHKKKLGRC